MAGKPVNVTVCIAVMVTELTAVPQLFVSVAVYIPGALTVVVAAAVPLLQLTVPVEPATLKVAVCDPHNTLFVVETVKLGVPVVPVMV